MTNRWEIKQLGEVCSIINGGTPSTSVVNYWNGNIQWITPKDMSGLTSKHIKKTERTISQEGVAHSSAKILPPQSVILSSRAPIGYVAINTVPMATNQGCKGIVTTNEIKSEFLYYFLIKSYDLLNNLGTGATFKELSGSKLASISIPVPPIEEQEPIVSLLDSAFSKIESLKKNAESSLENAKSLFQSALKKELEPKEGWEIKTIGEVCSFERGLTYSKDNEVSTSSLGVLRSNNIDVTSNKLNFDEIKYLNDEIEIPNAKKVKRNSILMCISNGSKSHLGKVAIIEDDIDFAFGGFMGLLTPNKQIIFPKYLYYSLTTPCYKLFIKNLSDGANINNLKFNELKEFSIPVLPIEEQERIVKKLDSLKEKCDVLQKNLEKTVALCDDLKQALLRQAFNGEL